MIKVRAIRLGKRERIPRLPSHRFVANAGRDKDEVKRTLGSNLRASASQLIQV